MMGALSVIHGFWCLPYGVAPMRNEILPPRGRFVLCMSLSQNPLCVLGRHALIHDILPFRMALRLRLEKWAEREDLPAAGAGCLYGVER